MAARAPVVAGRFAPLDGVRAVAALSIVLFHAVGIYARGSDPDAFVRPWVARLDVGVPVFFVLSAFLLYQPFVRARLERAQPSVRAYAWRRALRIVPGYWVALLFAVVVLGTGGVLTLEGIPTYFGFLQSYATDTAGGGIPVAWTLCIEVAFYAFLPVWALLVRRVLGTGTLRGELPALALLFVASIAWKVVVLRFATAGHVPALNAWIIAPPMFGDMFALGMGLAVLTVRWRERGGPPPWLLRWSWVWWLAAVALFAVAARAAGLADVDVRGFTHQQVLVRHGLYAAIALCFLVPATLGTGLPARVLRTQPLPALGVISYGIYLYHLTVLDLAGRWDAARLEDHLHPYVLWTAVAVGGSVLCAAASWRFVERPALALKSRGGPLLRRLPAERVPAG